MYCFTHKENAEMCSNVSPKTNINVLKAELRHHLLLSRNDASKCLLNYFRIYSFYIKLITGSKKGRRSFFAVEGNLWYQTLAWPLADRVRAKTHMA